MIQIEYVDPVILNPAPYNPRTMTDEALGRLASLLDAHGIVDPLIARRSDNLLIGGHQRLKANSMRTTPAAKVPVVYLDVDDEQAKALNIALNNPKAQGEYDYSILADILQELDAGVIDVEKATGFAEKDIAELMHGLDDCLPDGNVLPEPTLESECLIEIRCTKAALNDITETLNAWSERGDCTVDIS